MAESTMGPPRPLGQALMGPPKPDPSAPFTPVTDPAELEENKGLWKGFMDKIKTDPNFRQAVMQTGIGMMRGGQNLSDNALSVFGQGLQAGTTTLDLLRQRDAATKTETEKTEFDRRAKTREIEDKEKDTANQGTYYQGIIAGNTTSAALDERKQKEVERSNLANEATDKLKAQAEYKRAQLWGGLGGSGTPGAEAQMLEALTQEGIAAGLDPVKAKADAVRYLKTKGRELDTQAAAAKFFQAVIQGNPFLTPEEQKTAWEESKARAADLALMGTSSTKPVAGPTASPAAAGGAPAPVPGAVPSYLQQGGQLKPVDPSVAAWVKRQLGPLAKSPTEVAAFLKSQGHDPAAYGL